MKVHSNEFKNIIKKNGRQLDSKITFGNTVLGKNDLNAVTPSFQGGILKSVMKQLDIDSNIAIPIGTILKYEFGLKIDGEYEYIDFGNYVVKNIEKQEDTRSYKITCYDKMLFTMKDYQRMPITYPITIREYINAICLFNGLTFSNNNDEFANYDKQIQNELYLDENGNSLGYTFRDVLDELAQVTASTIVINDNDELEVRYINDTNDTIDEEFLKDVNVNFGEKFGEVNTIVLSRSADSDSVYYPEVLPDNPIEIKISDNQIMNFNDRADYLPDIYEKLNGLEFYINDFKSTGIIYYDICDKYNVKIGENVYSCVMFNDEIIVTQGLEENVYTEMPEETKTDYTKSDKDDRKINQAYLIVNKQEKTINALVSTQDDLTNRVSTNELNISAQETTIKIMSENIDLETGDIQSVKTTTGYTFDEEGLKISKSENGFNSLHNNVGTYYKDGDTILSQTTKDGTIIKDMVLYGRYYYGIDENLNVAEFNKNDAMFVAEKYVDDNYEEGFGHFYNGGE